MTTETKPLHQIADVAMAQGLAAAIERFIQRRGMNMEPTEKCVSPLAAFTVAVMAEFTGAGGEDMYPFDKSLKERLAVVMADCLPVMRELYSQNKLEEAQQFGRTMFYSEALLFLDDNLLEVIGLIKAIKKGL